MIAIGNGEKCPWCEIINTPEVDITTHFISEHEKEFFKALEGDSIDFG